MITPTKGIAKNRNRGYQLVERILLMFSVGHLWQIKLEGYYNWPAGAYKLSPAAVYAKARRGVTTTGCAVTTENVTEAINPELHSGDPRG